MSKKRTNWHEAAVCAIQITLRDYAHLLEYYPEYALGKGKTSLQNAFRIDLLVIRKLSEEAIPHSIAKIFKSHNLFEIKGVHSSVTVNAYYKTIGYASLLIALNGSSAPYARQDISLSFLCRRYPRKLIRHLTKDCGKAVANPSPGVYYIKEDIYPVQIIVTKELPAEDALYLRCLTDQLSEQPLLDSLMEDYSRHQELPAYTNYMNQLTNANIPPKGERTMYCEAIVNLYHTYTQDIAEEAARKAHDEDAVLFQQTTQKLNQELNLLKAKSQNDTKELERLKALLNQHNIAFEQTTT